jgi:Tfp pilus assembly protein PilF
VSERKPPPRGAGPADGHDLFDDLFDDVPPTDPMMPMMPVLADAGAAPPDAEAPVLFAPTLPEMEADIWLAGMEALVTVGEGAAGAPPSPEDWRADAHLYRDESALAATPQEASALLLAAGRAAEAAGDVTGAARGYDEALARVPDGPDALRARARLAESLGDEDEAHALWARLAVAATTAEERAFYGTLAAEWTLARRGSLPAVALDAIPAGPARSLAMAEAALREGAAAAAGALAAAGRAVGGAVGAALIEQAGRVALTARDASAASAYLAAARRLAPGEVGIPLAALGGAARASGKDAERRLAELLPAVPPASPLTEAVRRWAAGLARARGDVAAASELLGHEVASLAAARDRLDLDAAAGVPLSPAALERARAGAASPAAAATLTWIEAQSLRHQRDDAAAAALLAAAIDAAPEAVPLALIAEEIAADTADPGLRASALETWLRGDDARRAPAAMALAEVRDAAGSGLTARAALQTALEAAPTSAVFWEVAGNDARAGRRNDAAAVLAYGAEIWIGSALEAPLRACAAAKLAPSDPARALEALATADTLSPAAKALGPEAVARLGERAGDLRAVAAALDAAATATTDPAVRAWIELRQASAAPASDSGSRAIAFEAALRVAPAHPIALSTYLAEPAVDAGAAAATLARAGQDRDVPAFARVASLAAVSLQVLSGDAAAAVRSAAELLAEAPGDRLARGAALRAAIAVGDPRGPAAAAGLAIDTARGAIGDGPDDLQALAIAEARLVSGDAPAARFAFQRLEAGRFAADARRFGGRASEGGPAGSEDPALALRNLLGGASDVAAARAAERLAKLADAAVAGRWRELVAALADKPPHEDTAEPATLGIAAALAEGHDEPQMADALAAAAVRVATDAPAGRATLHDLGHVALTGEAELRRRALGAAVAAMGVAESDRRAAAWMWAARARVDEELGQPDAAADSRRAALAADPTFLPAARALRITAARAGDPLATAAAAETEASCLTLPANRVRSLLLAAALALEADPPARARALADLRAALAADPGHEAAFERLRSLLAEQGDARGLAAALAARTEMAQNPFEVTSLRLARAELLARELGDPDGARAELEAVLRKQPEHPRALEALSELLWNRQEWAEAGEIYLRRAVVERDAATRSRIFLRLGQIYSTHVADPKRAAAAYERALSVDDQNVEALRALSDLYLREGDTKRALPITERLVACEPDPARRHRTRVRFGELLMQVGDLGRAGVELRRAFDESPRDVETVTALVQQLERARDLGGRRGVLDRALGLLRHDLTRASGREVATLRALASLLVLRERPHAARAAAQLAAVLAGERTTEMPARSVAKLRQPDVDERSFPPDLPSGIRHLMRAVGPSLRPTGAELAQRLGRHGVTRADRRARGAPPRPSFDVVANELGVPSFELYVRAAPAVAGPAPLRVEPGDPPVILLGDAIEALGPAALRFAAGRALRLCATQLDLLLAVPAEEAGALLVGIIRQFVPDYRHEAVREPLAAAETARVERVMPRKLKQTLMPYAVESAGPFDLTALLAAVRDGANAAGLLACADLPAALAVLLELPGPAGTLTPAALIENPEALALLQFAISDTYDDLAQALEV